MAEPAIKPAEPKLIKTIDVDHQLGCARFRADGKVLAAGAYDATVRLWSVKDDALEALPSLKGHNGWVDALVFHPSQPRLFTADTWGKLICWEWKDEANEPRVKWSHDAAHDGWIRSIAISSDGHTLATCGRDGVVRVWSADDGKLRHELKEQNEEVYSVAFHPTDHTLVSGNLKGTIRIWDLKQGRTARTIDASSLYKYDRIQDVGGARYLNFTRDGATLLCAGATPDGGGFVQAKPRILGFDFKTGEKKIDITLGESKDGFVYEVHEHADGFLMAVTSGQPGNGRLLFVQPNETTPFFTGQKMANCHALALHPGGTLMAVLATNTNSAGNGRRVNKDGQYVGNTSPIHLWKFEA